MLVTSKTDAARAMLFLFLRDHDVRLIRSDDFQAIGRLNSRRQLIAAVGYNGFNGRTCCAHFAGVGNWLSRELLFAGFDYPFVQAGVVEMFAPVPGNNARALKLDKHLGFTERYVVKQGWEPGVDLHMMGMRKEDCRWLKGAVKNELKVA